VSKERRREEVAARLCPRHDVMIVSAVQQWHDVKAYDTMVDNRMLYNLWHRYSHSVHVTGHVKNDDTKNYCTRLAS